MQEACFEHGFGSDGRPRQHIPGVRLADKRHDSWLFVCVMETSCVRVHVCDANCLSYGR